MGSAEERRGIAIAAAAGAVAASAVLAACAVVRGARSKGSAESEEPEVTAAEDLMREHGILRRLLLVYEDGLARIDRGAPPLDVIGKAADLVRRFVEEYHEETEERYVFPLFEKAGTMVDMVHVLRVQHDAGRRVTDTILQRTQAGVADADLVSAMHAFLRMYRPHAAQEDTVLFPRMRDLVGAKAYAEMGNLFEDEERARFGPQGFERIEAEVSRLEERLGIHDLAQFTPRRG
jgi:hemerythrin-like domain-containing protein